MKSLIFITTIIIIFSTCNTANMNSCPKNIENTIHHTILESFDFQSCTFNEILSYFNLLKEDGRFFYLGKNRKSHKYYEWWKEKCRIRLWFDNQNLMKVDIDKYIESPKNILFEIGEPKLKLDYYIDVILIEKKAYIYPKKGIAIYFDQVPDKIEQISYFKPTTAQIYIDSLHDFSVPREFPFINE